MRAKVLRILSFLFLLAITVLVFLPLMIILIASFKSLVEIGGDFPLKLPSSLNFDNYVTVLTQGNLLRGFKNSTLLVVFTLVINIMLGTMTAYSLSRYRFKLRSTIMALFLIGMIVPQLISEIARFQVISSMHLYDKIWGPVIIYCTVDLVQIYIYIQFMEKIPKSIDESAMLDGCNRFQVFFRIILPMMKPAMATVAIIKAVDVINDMYIPKLYMPSPELGTLTTTLLKFSNGKFSSWNTLSAAIVLVMLPTILLYFVFQRYIFDGIVAGAVKE